MTKEELDALQALAEKATQGEWRVQTGCSWRRIGTEHGDGDVLRPVKHPHDGWPDLAGPMENLEFIAAANPQAILSLIARIRELEGQRNAGHCIEGDKCACGGDLPRVREGCANWRTK